MKANRIYILSVLAFLLIVFLLEARLPKKFVWVPTYEHNDHQPFGCAVFDDVLSHSFEEGYSITDKTLYQLAEDSTSAPNILIIGNWLNPGSADTEALLAMAEQGRRILLAGSSFGRNLRDTLGFNYIESGHFNIRYLREFSSRDTLCWVADSIYGAAVFAFYPQLCRNTFSECDSLNTSLALVGDSLPVAISQKIGKGEIVLVSTPLLFTNYGVLDGGNAAYLYRLLNRLKGAPLVRSVANLSSHGLSSSEQTPLRYFLSQRPLRWALYGTLLLLVLFMIFTARRKQRVIPVVREPENKTIEFIELIGTLYYQRKNHTDLLCKKYNYFAEQLRRGIQVDIEGEADEERISRKIADKTGVDQTKIKLLLQTIRPVIRGEALVSEEEMQRLVKEMNEIIKQI